jgi:hypothetical protein
MSLRPRSPSSRDASPDPDDVPVPQLIALTARDLEEAKTRPVVPLPPALRLKAGRKQESTMDEQEFEQIHQEAHRMSVAPIRMAMTPIPPQKPSPGRPSVARDRYANATKTESFNLSPTHDGRHQKDDDAEHRANELKGDDSGARAQADPDRVSEDVQEQNDDEDGGDGLMLNLEVKALMQQTTKNIHRQSISGATSFVVGGPGGRKTLGALRHSAVMRDEDDMAMTFSPSASMPSTKSFREVRASEQLSLPISRHASIE